MSLTKLVFPVLSWSELWDILSFLSLRDLWRLGTTCRSAFVTFLREKTFRKGLKARKLTLENPLPHARFLSKYSRHNKILLVSYPRSGNSYVRKMLETTTGIVTGSDSRPNRVLSASLLEFGYCGEGITDQSVWVVKSHYPERLGFIRFPVHRILLIVRNPFDAIESYFHMSMTNTHDKVLSDEAFQSLLSLWKEFLRNEVMTWIKFHEFWLNQASILPTIIVRYEDLLLNESYWMQQIIKFLEEGKTPDGYQRFSKHMMKKAVAAGVGYNPKNSRIGKSFASIPLEEFQFILENSKFFLDYFQYQIQPSTPPSSHSIPYALSINPFYFSSKQPLNEPISENGATSPSPATPPASTLNSSMLLINDNVTIRPNDDQFGRKITSLRKSYTKNDTEPFPTK